MESQDLNENLLSRLLSLSLGIALASIIPQTEVFTGQCGLNPSYMHMLFVIISVTGLISSLGGLVGYSYTKIKRGPSLAIGSICYLVVCLGIGDGTFLLADRILLASLMVVVIDGGRATRKFLIGSIILSTGITKFVDQNCDGAWYSFGSLQADAINQPFPFTPVWHLAQLPESYSSLFSMVIVVSELGLPFLLLFSRSRSVFENAVAISIACFSTFYYSVIGNFNWSALVVIAMCISLVDSDILVLLLGEQIFVRWGFENVTFNEARAESLFLNVLLRLVAVVGAIGVGVGVVVIVFAGDLGNLTGRYPVADIGAVVLVLATLFAVVSAHKESGLKGPILVLLGLILAGSSFLSVLTFSAVPFTNDYSSLPTCYSFHQSAGIDFPVHSKSGRAGFLFQTKYSVIGTNTVGSDLGGTKYAELSLPGSVHADEQRPPFLLGHLPRLALRLWKTGTGDLNNIRSGLELVDFLSGIVREGGNAMRVFFPDTDDKVLEALGAVKGNKKNEIRGFYQQYQVTSRAADHQWWKRSYDNVAALPSLGEGKVKNLPPKDCSAIVPQKLFGFHSDLILITGFLGVLLLKILLSNPKKSSAGSSSSPSKSHKKTN